MTARCLGRRSGAAPARWRRIAHGIAAAGLGLLLLDSTKAVQANPPANTPPTAPAKMVIEPRALDWLKAACDRLVAAKSMSFTAVASYEFPSKLGPPLLYSVRYEVAMQRPDKLRVIIPGDGPASQFYYDGKTIMAYAPVENLVAVADAPPTIDGALKASFENADIYFPFEELVVSNPYPVLTEGAILAFNIGPSNVVGGVKTDMLAWANPEVFLQIWIGAEDKLPRRVRATYSADPAALRHEVDFSDWKIDPVLPPGTFESQAAAAARRIVFDRPTGSKRPPGLKPLWAMAPAPPGSAQPATKPMPKSP